MFYFYLFYIVYTLLSKLVNKHPLAFLFCGCNEFHPLAIPFVIMDVKYANGFGDDDFEGSNPYQY